MSTAMGPHRFWFMSRGSSPSVPADGRHQSRPSSDPSVDGTVEQPLSRCSTGQDGISRDNCLNYDYVPLHSIPEQFAAHLRIPTSILDFSLVTPTSTNINVAPQSDCRSDANTRLEVAATSSPEWDSLNLEYPPGVTDQIYTTALPPFPEWDGLQLEYPPELEVSHPGDQIEKTSLNPALPPAPGRTGNAGDVAAFPAPLPSMGQTPENWTEAETAVFGRADPADDEWTDEESNQTGITIPRSGRENPGVPKGKDSEWEVLFIHRAQ
ncbi:hypothetical protein B0H14DRAFT_3125893 [Mycena olivaceomarginata]|nr:hypothetical protein B0H14DRAFT_3125893 [Mycena olivaceomarginata]